VNKELFENPPRLCTKTLPSAVPSTDIHNKQARVILDADIVSPTHPKPGCRLAARCEYESRKCHEPQQLEEVLPKHFVSCRRVTAMDSF
jgi:oligopeptide/dipeptide ABC transporter ATP-binding protein